MSREMLDRVVRVCKVAVFMATALLVMARAVSYGNENEDAGWTPYVMSVVFGIVLTFTGVALAAGDEYADPEEAAAV